MYKPFAEAMNYALERLSEIEVDGLPKFNTHIAFVPCNEGVQSDCIVPGSSFKPDLAVMSIEDAFKWHKIDQTHKLGLSALIGKIAGKKPPGSINWKTILSAVEMKRNPQAYWAKLGEFDGHQGHATQGVDNSFSEKLDDPELTTGKIRLF